MTIFAIIPTSGKDKILQEIKSQFPQEFFPVSNGDVLVSFNGTSKELSDKLKISEGVSGTALVLLVNGYFGRATPDVWEWLNLKSKAL